jgi:diguanylate cyclase (GGDEF)-like protein
VTAFAALLDGLPHPAWLVALGSGSVVAANQSAALCFEQPCAALLGQQALDLAASPEDLAWWAGAAAGDCSPLVSDTLLALPGGLSMHVSRSIRAVALDGGSSPSHALVMLVDRSTEQRAGLEREMLVADLQATLEATADGILVTDLTGKVRTFNRRFAQLWALPADLLLQRDDTAVWAWMQNSVFDVPAFEAWLLAIQGVQATPSSPTGDEASAERITLRSGQVLERVMQPLRLAGRLQGRVSSFRDLSASLAAQARIDSLATHDVLTGLPNRRLLGEQIAAVTGHKTRALLVVDLDRFAHINDSLGQATGDRVLLDVSQRIQGCLRQDDLLARLGGDQFAVLLQGADAAAAEASARRILNVVAQPCRVEDVTFTLTCSIGLALAPSHGENLDDLVRHAETAMRAVKAAGRANFKLHQARADVDRRAHMQLDHAMRQALVSGRFRLHYQPQVNVLDGRVVGAEALMRWRDPALGEVSPGRFIPVAEESGFIIAMGDWVLTQAVRQAVLWHQRGLGLPVAINVSALQFQQAHFVDRVASVLAVSGLPPHLLELELTESILVHDADEALHRLGALSRLGVRMAIDDFGTGYSSLAYLKRFPIDKLKIDRSFITGLPADGSDAGIVRAILQMARALGMGVIAEGVETEAQRQFLQEAGCGEYQGFLYAPAMDALSFEQHLLAATSVAVGDTSQARPKRGVPGAAATAAVAAAARTPQRPSHMQLVRP